ncbi:MAG: tRNA (adenosine(37)-N6)-threonylcarbamoyltransferase complex dimerization subunit type 1 TsaB [Clostridia bacterium]|nr:tRNA (adenosine(37)-N6)-threonylcarbamoyltransferase complex dimerization subunit type 1 TsaB [Clostridia bacterium]
MNDTLSYIAVDTSSRYLTVLAKCRGGKALRYTPECAMRHSVILMDEISKALSEAGMEPKDADFFAAVTGPGSFTGIRIGISAVKGFALACGKPMMGITSFDLLADGIRDERFYVVIDAGHDHYYVQGYEGGCPLQPAFMPGDKVRAYDAPLYGFEDLPLDGYTRLNPGDMLEGAVESGRHPLGDAIEALYVRKSQAEEARECR